MVEIHLIGSLVWPKGTPRKTVRRSGNFKLKGDGTLARAITATEAVTRLSDELRLWDAKNAELSADLGVTRGGRHSLAVPSPTRDPGCVLIFDADGKTFTLPCDTFTELAQNIAGLAAHLNSVRAQERYGVATAAQSMGAFLALPSSTRWREILRNPVSLADAQTVYRELSRRYHPDNPETGDGDRMAEIGAAMNEARAFFEGGA